MCFKQTPLFYLQQSCNLIIKDTNFYWNLHSNSWLRNRRGHVPVWVGMMHQGPLGKLPKWHWQLAIHFTCSISVSARVGRERESENVSPSLWLLVHCSFVSRLLIAHVSDHMKQQLGESIPGFAVLAQPHAWTGLRVRSQCFWSLRLYPFLAIFLSYIAGMRAGAHVRNWHCCWCPIFFFPGN